MKTLPEEAENYRDKKWRREETLKIEKAIEVEAMVEDLGFCLGLTDSRTNLPSVYIAVCGRRDAFSPKNVQKDYEMSLAWVLRKGLLFKARTRSLDVRRASLAPLFQRDLGRSEKPGGKTFVRQRKQNFESFAKRMGNGNGGFAASDRNYNSRPPDQSDGQTAAHDEGRAAGSFV